MAAREEAVARVRSLAEASDETVKEFKQEFEAAKFNLSEWHFEHPVQIEKLKQLKTDLELMQTYIETESLVDNHPWDRFYRWAEKNLSLEGQEQLVSLLLEPYGEIVDGLIECMDADEHLSFLLMAR